MNRTPVAYVGLHGNDGRHARGGQCRCNSGEGSGGGIGTWLSGETGRKNDESWYGSACKESGQSGSPEGIFFSALVFQKKNAFAADLVESAVAHEVDDLWRVITDLLEQRGASRMLHNRGLDGNPSERSLNACTIAIEIEIDRAGRTGQCQHDAFEGSGSWEDRLLDAIDRPHNRASRVEGQQMTRIRGLIEQDLPRQSEDRPKTLIARVQKDPDPNPFVRITADLSPNLLIQVANPASNQRLEESGAAFPESFGSELPKLSKIPLERRVELEWDFRRLWSPSRRYDEPVAVRLNSQIEILIRDHRDSEFCS